MEDFVFSFFQKGIESQTFFLGYSSNPKNIFNRNNDRSDDVIFKGKKTEAVCSRRAAEG